MRRKKKIALTATAITALIVLGLCAVAVLEVRERLRLLDTQGEWEPGSEWTPPASTMHLPIFRSPLNVLVQDADMIARVKHLDVQEHTLKPGQDQGIFSDLNYNTDRFYQATLAHKFEVLEYFKGGDGSREIWGLVALWHAIGDSEEETRAAYNYYSERRDSTWDDREAIVFMFGPVLNSSNRYYLGDFIPELGETYTIRTGQYWLPAASSGAAGAQGDNQEFLYTDPESESASVSGASSINAPSTLTISQLKSVTDLPSEELERQLQATATAFWNREMAVSNLEASATNTSITLSWHVYGSEVVTEFVTGYKILRRTQSDSDFIEIAGLPGGAEFGDNTYVDTHNIVSGTKYIYLIRPLKNSNYRGGYGADVRVEIRASAGATAKGMIPSAEMTATPKPERPAATATPAPIFTPTPTIAPPITPTAMPAPSSGGATGQ